MATYFLESNQADRIRFDQMVERALRPQLSELKDYYRDDPETAANALWDQYSQEYSDDDPEYARDMGLIFVEDMDEAEARFRAVAISLLRK